MISVIAGPPRSGETRQSMMIQRIAKRYDF